MKKRQGRHGRDVTASSRALDLDHPRHSESPANTQVPTFSVNKHIQLGGLHAEATAQEFFAFMAQEAYARQGEAAFENPKWTTCLHEAGHCIVHAIQGDVPDVVRISRARDSGGRSWIGCTKIEGSRRPAVDNQSDPMTDYEVASSFIAGYVAEITFDGENIRLGSSLDEILALKIIAHTVARKTGRDERLVALEIMGRTAQRLRTHEAVVRAIADRLMRKHHLGQKRLAILLQPVLHRRHVTPWGEL